jgi:hypothetical protein
MAMADDNKIRAVLLADRRDLIGRIAEVNARGPDKVYCRQALNTFGQNFPVGTLLMFGCVGCSAFGHDKSGRLIDNGEETDLGAAKPYPLRPLA